MEQKFKPLGDRVLIKPIEADSKTKSGIVIPDAAKERPLEGVVVSVGDHKDLILNIGDKVIYGRYVGSEVILEKESYIVMRQSDVYSVIN